MKSEILKKLAAVAESLDSKGLYTESNFVDSIMLKISAKLDPVGEEDEDIDNDGKKNTKTDKYLANRRKAIGKAMKGKSGAKSKKSKAKPKSKE